MAKGFTEEDDALLAELGVEIETKKVAARTPREERILAGFEEIQRFVDQNGRVPSHGDDRDIFERIYATRLDSLRELGEASDLLLGLDHQGLLSAGETASETDLDQLDDDALLAELGIEADVPAISELKHVRSAAEKKAAEEIAGREKCDDFDRYKPLFEQIQKELDSGLRETRKFEIKAEIEPGRFFIVGGQKAYVAEMGEIEITDHGRTDARLRVIFDNGTQSKMLMRSLQRALNADGEAGRRITEPSAGPLFSNEAVDGDEASGTIYVLRSQSNHPLVADNRELIHKIGVTGNDVQKRIAGAQLQTTFLMAKVDVVATYKLYNINRGKLEALLHRIFAPAQVDIEINDRFGRPIKPREWFMVPLFVIEEAIQKIKDGTISGYVYNPQKASLEASKPIS
ncbi:GIY-YIG nuclease family protein [Tritonibacter mobilis]|uniref:GIY-YIG nuclease family protein n=1 Tax=Tritonibacter mobilis TaxID=379347 RepID=UPI001C09E09C|nr:GIY-YIG nuclease family protein [Tritonibacter mobilis]MBU3034994.1 GIY-YIG nuclease family protein [Tritonibacter mobilis]WHQ83470.1 GIY-YIG nuclease family protein [Tritonibacter mobilis]